jgi:hypothetical protein
VVGEESERFERSANKKPSSIPMANRADIIEVKIAPAQSTSALSVTSSISGHKKPISVYQTNSPSVKEQTVKFLRLRGIAGVRWMNDAIFDCFVELLEGPLDPDNMSSLAKDVDPYGYWKEPVVFPGYKVPADT